MSPFRILFGGIPFGSNVGPEENLTADIIKYENNEKANLAIENTLKMIYRDYKPQDVEQLAQGERIRWTVRKPCGTALSKDGLVLMDTPASVYVKFDNGQIQWVRKTKVQKLIN